MSEFTYEELAPHYQLDRNSLEITRVDCVPVTLEDFKEITKKLPPSHNLELAANKITVKMPVSALTGMLFLLEFQQTFLFRVLIMIKK